MKKYQLWILFIAFGVVCLLVSKVELRMDITDFFFAGNNEDAAFLVNQLNNDKIQRRIILSIEHSDEYIDTVFEFISQFENALKDLDGVEQIWSASYQQEQLLNLLEHYDNYQTALYSLNPEDEIRQLFDKDNLKTRVERTKSLLLGPDPSLVKSLIQVDPMLLTLDWLEKIHQAFAASDGSGGVSILFLETKALAMNINAQQELQLQIESIFKQINNNLNGQFSLGSTGIPVFAIKIKSQIDSDIQKVSQLSILIILIIFVVIFRSLKSMLLTACLLAFTVACAVLMTQAVFGFVHGLTLALGITLIGICIDYYIHAMINASKGLGDQGVENVKKIWPSLILGGCTTLLGYFALAASGFPGLQQIALFSITGIIIALIISRYVVAQVMNSFSLVLKPRLPSQYLLRYCDSQKLKWSIITIVLACFLMGVKDIKWSQNLDTLSADLEALKLKDSQIRSQISNISPGRFIVVEAPDIESALRRNESVQILLNQLHEQGIVRQYSAVYPWIASENLQARNTQAWAKALDQTNLNNWYAALKQAGFSEQAFTNLNAIDVQQLNFQQFKDSPAFSMLSNQILIDNQQATLITLLGQHDVALVKQTLEGLEGVRYFSHKENIDSLAISYRQKAQIMLFAGLAAIFVLFLWRFRSVTQSVKILLPALLAILFVFGVTGMIGKPMNMIHLVGLLLTAAICVDYGIFYFENRSQNRQLTFQAISASALTSSASFACLGIADNPALQALSLTVAPGIIIGFLLCPVILRTSQ